jgi:hypothetical protein
MSHLRIVLVAVLLACAVGLRPGLAAAQSAADTATARELYIEGAKLSKEERWEQAKDRLKRSLELKKAPITHYSLAVAQQKTGELVEALENFRAFLVAPSAAATESLREPAEQAAEKLSEQVARVAITIRPDGLESLSVSIDGVKVPTAALDRPRLVNPGRHELRATAAGHAEASQSFTVEEGGSAEVTLTLEPAAEPTAEPEPEPEPAAAPPAEPPDEGASIAGPVVTLVTGIVAIGVGVAVGLVGVSEAEDAPASEGPEADAARTKGLAGDIVAGVGGAVAAVGLIWLIVAATSGPDEDEASAADAARLRPWAAGPVAGVQVQF